MLVWWQLRICLFLFVNMTQIFSYSNPQPIKIVATLSVWYKRLYHPELRRCILSVLDIKAGNLRKNTKGSTIFELSDFLFDRVYVHIPLKYKIRESKVSQVNIPDWLIELNSSYYGRLVISRCEDFGPATKLLPMLLLSDDELPRNSIIVQLDDDILYSETVVRNLIRSSISYPEQVTGGQGWNLRHMLDTIDWSTWNRSHVLGSRVETNPDVWRASFLRKIGEIHSEKFTSETTLKNSKFAHNTALLEMDILLGCGGISYRKQVLLGIKPPQNFSNGDGKSLRVEKLRTIIGDDGKATPLLFRYDLNPAFSAYCQMVDDMWISGILAYLGVKKVAYKVHGQVKPKQRPRAAILDMVNKRASTRKIDLSGLEIFPVRIPLQRRLSMEALSAREESETMLRSAVSVRAVTAFGRQDSELHHDCTGTVAVPRTEVSVAGNYTSGDTSAAAASAALAAAGGESESSDVLLDNTARHRVLTYKGKYNVDVMAAFREHQARRNRTKPALLPLHLTDNLSHGPQQSIRNALCVESLIDYFHIWS